MFLTNTDYVLIALSVFFSLAAISNLLPQKKNKENKNENKNKKDGPSQQDTTSWNDRLTSGLASSRLNIWGKIGSLISSQNPDDELIEELEEILYTSDLSPNLVEELLEKLKNDKSEVEPKDKIKNFIIEKMKTSQLKLNNKLFEKDDSENKTQVIMVVGINGAGKTTTIGKLATKFKKQNAKVVVGACDTFRAAAVEQLEVWCKRADVEMIKASEGADPSGVAYEAVKSAYDQKADYCIIDTAGRLHTASNLMDELKKTKKVMSKINEDAPQHTLLVIDAITGQNALRQAEEFHKSLDLSGLVFTKCDGSSKAGSAVSIVDKLQIPIAYIGVGESEADLNKFDLDAFVEALVG